MITLHLNGKLAEIFGDRFNLQARTPREAVTALMYQSKQYKDYLHENDWHIFVGEGNDISEAELDLTLGSIKDVYLIPRIEGANGAVTFIAGAILTVVGFVLNVGSFGALSPLGVPMMAVGIGMMVGGIIQMTTKVPKADSSKRDAVDDQSSFLFSGPTNTSTQGVAIPRGYGRMLTGSIVVSAALYAENTSSYIAPPIDLTEKVDGWVRV